MTSETAIGVVIGAYLLGSVSFAYLFVRGLRGVDLRTVGSGNLGATNAGRVLGRGYAVLIYALDFMKGLLPVVLVRRAGDPAWSGANGLPVALTAGIAAFLGHCLPVWHGFRGGKGVATASGLVLALAPLPALIVFALFAVLVAVTRMISVGSIAAALALPFMFILWGGGLPPDAAGRWTLAVFAALGVAVTWLHRANIRRIFAGQENKIGGVRK